MSGNNESAGKRKSGKSPVRKHGFKTLLVEISWAAVKAKGSFYRAKYFRLKVRIGAKKAIIAIAHKIAIAIFHIIKHGEHFKDLGEKYLAEKYEARKVLSLHKQAKDMGFNL